MSLNKNKIAASFSKSSVRYDQYATVQQKSAEILIKRLRQIVEKLPVGPILEFGCGTGKLSENIINVLPDREILLTDISQGMLEQCQQKLLSASYGSKRISIKSMDIEDLDTPDSYALIISGLTLQWFQHTRESLSRLVSALLPEGYLLCSYIGSQSFPEWREQCAEIGLPCSVNPLPEEEKINQYLQEQVGDLVTWCDPIVIEYKSSRDFFNSLKNTGTNTSENECTLDANQMKSLLTHWDSHSPDQRVKATYYVHTVCVRK